MTVTKYNLFVVGSSQFAAIHTGDGMPFVKNGLVAIVILCGWLSTC